MFWTSSLQLEKRKFISKLLLVEFAKRSAVKVNERKFIKKVLARLQFDRWALMTKNKFNFGDENLDEFLATSIFELIRVLFIFVCLFSRSSFVSLFWPSWIMQLVTWCTIFSQTFYLFQQIVWLVINVHNVNSWLRWIWYTSEFIMTIYNQVSAMKEKFTRIIQ